MGLQTNETFFSKGDTTSWITDFYTITQIIIVTKSTNRRKMIPERYDEALLRKSGSSKKEGKCAETIEYLA